MHLGASPPFGVCSMAPDGQVSMIREAPGGIEGTDPIRADAGIIPRPGLRGFADDLQPLDGANRAGGIRPFL